MEKPYYVIEVKAGSGAESTHEINSESVVLGRSKKKADVVIDDPKTSGAHASISFKDNRVLVTDLGSTNGTHFSGTKQSLPFEVAAGQSFRVAQSIITLVAIHPAEPEAPVEVEADTNPAPLIEEEDATRAMPVFDLEASAPPPPSGAEAVKPMPAERSEPVAAPPAPEPVVEAPAPPPEPEPEPEPVVEAPAPPPAPQPEPVVEAPAPVPEPEPEPVAEAPVPPAAPDPVAAMFSPSEPVPLDEVAESAAPETPETIAKEAEPLPPIAASVEERKPVMTASSGPRQRSYALALILSVQFGIMGFDRFYLGKIGTGILKGVTFGGFGLWWIFDIFKLCNNEVTDIDGRPLKGQEVRDPSILLFLSVSFYGLFNRLYLRQGILGWAKVLTLGGFGIWCLIDIYLVLKNKLHDTKGLPLQPEEQRYQGVALLLSMSGGFFGLDRHYLGHKSMAMLKFFTFGGFFIWWFIDLIDIIKNRLTDVNGNELAQD